MSAVTERKLVRPSAHSVRGFMGEAGLQVAHGGDARKAIKAATLLVNSALLCVSASIDMEFEDRDAPNFAAMHLLEVAEAILDATEVPA